jgi:diguanylate cyclase (GGDEF)-like protein/hemerythrin-like metal-binding protein
MFPCSRSLQRHDRFHPPHQTSVFLSGSYAMLIDARTLFAPLIAEQLTVCVATSLMARRSEVHKGGLYCLGASMGISGLAFILFALRDFIHPLLGVWLANIGLTASASLGVLAITTFQRRRISAAILWSPVAIVAVVFLVYLHEVAQSVLISTLVLIIQYLYGIFLLFRTRRQTPGFGQYLILCGCLPHVVMLALHAAAISIAHEGSLPIGSSHIAQGVYLSIFAMVNLFSIGYVLMIRESHDERYRQLALHDRLTECWNRVYLERVATQEMERLKRYGTPVALAILDIDHFKQVNDSYGHATGDKVLRCFAATARACIRSTDVLARWGGEEFILLLPASGYAAVASLTERIRTEFAASLPEGLPVTLSAGYASCQTTDTWEDWFGRADTALYRAKTGGRNRVEPEMPLQPPAHHTALLFHMPWRSDYHLGNAVIDAEHLALFDLADRLLAGARERASHHTMNEILSVFMAQLQAHFATEDILLAAHTDPEAQAHLSLHKALREKAEHLLGHWHRKQIEIDALLHFIVLEITVQHMLLADNAIAHLIADPTPQTSLGAM